MASKGTIVQDALKKFRNASSHSIADWLMANHPQYFKDHESARSLVRYYRGAIGERCRAFIPRAQPSVVSTYELTRYPIIASGDWHIPYHDEDAIEVMLDEAARIGAKTLLIAGDFFDFYQGSKFSKDPTAPRLKEEVDMGKEILSGIQADFPDTKIVLKLGNHERRWDTMMRLESPALADFDFFCIREMLSHELPSGIDIVNHTDTLIAGKLTIIHGHEYGGGSSAPVNPARLMFLKAKKSVLCFHFHQVSEHIETNIAGDVVGSWSGGCLCQLHPEYAPLNKWAHGFAEIYAEGDDGSFRVDNKKIVNYRLM